MTRLRIDTGQPPQVVAPVTWGGVNSRGYGTAHVTTWRQPHELRECRRPGCTVGVCVEDKCRSCQQPTVLLSSPRE